MQDLKAGVTRLAEYIDEHNAVVQGQIYLTNLILMAALVELFAQVDAQGGEIPNREKDLKEMGELPASLGPVVEAFKNNPPFQQGVKAGADQIQAMGQSLIGLTDTYEELAKKQGGKRTFAHLDKVTKILGRLIPPIVTASLSLYGSDGADSGEASGRNN